MPVVGSRLVRQVHVDEAMKFALQRDAVGGCGGGG